MFQGHLLLDCFALLLPLRIQAAKKSLMRLGLLSGFKRLAGHSQTKPTSESPEQQTAHPPDCASKRREIVAIFADGSLRMFEGRIPVYHHQHHEEAKTNLTAGKSAEMEQQPYAMRNIKRDPVGGFVVGKDSEEEGECLPSGPPSRGPTTKSGNACSSTRRSSSSSSSSTVLKNPWPTKETSIPIERIAYHRYSSSTSSSSGFEDSASSALTPKSTDMNDMRSNQFHRTGRRRKRVPASNRLNMTREARRKLELGVSSSSAGKPQASDQEERGRSRIRVEEERNTVGGSRERTNVILANFARWEWPARSEEDVESVPELVHSADKVEEAPVGRLDLLKRAEALRRAMDQGKEDGIKSFGKSLIQQLRVVDERWGRGDGFGEQDGPNPNDHDGRETQVDEVPSKASWKGRTPATPSFGKAKGHAVISEERELASECSPSPVRDDTYVERLARLAIHDFIGGDALVDALDACFGPTLLNRTLYCNDGDNNLREDERRSWTLMTFEHKSALTWE